jgi:hypothetical protein
MTAAQLLAPEQEETDVWMLWLYPMANPFAGTYFPKKTGWKCYVILSILKTKIQTLVENKRKTTEGIKSSISLCRKESIATLTDLNLIFNK